MKTIAIAAAAILFLSATAWADEPASKTATADEPILLGDAEMDDITAGTVPVGGGDRLFKLADNINPLPQSADNTPKFRAGKALKDSLN